MPHSDETAQASEGPGNVGPSSRWRLLTFLATHPLFQGLDHAGRESLATVIIERIVPAHETVLLQGGPPSDELLIIGDGIVELLRGEQVIDVMGKGELFGELSMLTGSSPELTVRTLEVTRFYVVPRPAAYELLGSPAGLAFAADNFRARLARAMSAAREPSAGYTAPISALVQHAPPVCPPHTPIREATSLMSEATVTAVLVEGRNGFGIVTNSDLRDRVMLGGVSPDAPVERIMTTPVLSVPESTLTADAALEMMNAGVKHVLVVDTLGRPIGIVSADSFMTLGALSPLALRHSLSAARDRDEVIADAARLSDVFLGLVDSRLEAPAISRVLTAEQDAIVVRLIELALEEQGPAPARFAWLALGSAARAELTLASDQDNALAYADSDDPLVEDYFAVLSASVTAGLVACGFQTDFSGVTADKPEWRGSESAWRRLFARCLALPSESYLMGALIAFDFRRVTGDLAVVPPLLDIIRTAPSHPDFMARLAATATESRSPLGFRRRLTGPIDLKKAGLLPIENVARYHAISRKITIPGTLDRLASVEEAGGLDGETVASLRAAFAAIGEVRLRHHASALREGRRPTNAFDSAELPRLAHAELQEALRVVDDARKLIPAFLHRWG